MAKFQISRDPSDPEALSAVAPEIRLVESLRALRIGVRLKCCFGLIVFIMSLGIVPAIWQLNFYNRQVERLSSIDRRMISVLKVNNQVLSYREAMQTAAIGNDSKKLHLVLIPFRTKFIQDVAEASAALRDSGSSRQGLPRTTYTLLSYQTAIPREIDATLELAEFQDWQAVHYRVDKQTLRISRVLNHIVSEIEAEANADRKATLQTMTAIRYRVIGVLPLGFSLLLLVSGGLLGARVTRSIAEPLSRLEAGAHALGSGNFSYRVGVNGKDELAIVAIAFNSAAARIEQLHAGLEDLVAERTADLRQANESLQRLSSQDPLTGIANRRTFNQRLQDELSRALQNGSPVSLLMVDVDHFKGLNDAYGHQKGDECLIQIVRTLESISRHPNGLIARFGGEEFAVVLGETDAAGAAAVAERMRRSVEDLAVPNRATPLRHLSISIGAATVWPTTNTPIEALVEQADQALYRAKQDGRNRVRAAQETREFTPTPTAPATPSDFQSDSDWPLQSPCSARPPARETPQAA